MTLTYLNAVLDTNIEHELFNITPKGFEVTITYKAESWLAKAGMLQQVFSPCTEVHHLFKGIDSINDAIAFESDILSEGFVRKIEDIESVVIKLAE